LFKNSIVTLLNVAKTVLDLSVLFDLKINQSVSQTPFSTESG